MSSIPLNNGFYENPEKHLSSELRNRTCGYCGHTHLMISEAEFLKRINGCEAITVKAIGRLREKRQSGDKPMRNPYPNTGFGT